MDRNHMRRCLLIMLGLAWLAFAQSYTGPRPEKPDLPYLKHATSLLATEAGVSRDEKKKDTITHIIDGAHSSAVTPLASPMFLFQAEKIAPESLSLVKLESKNGRREVTETQKRPLRTLRITPTRLTPDKLWQIEVDDSLEPGEYALTPDQSDKVFCFQVR